MGNNNRKPGATFLRLLLATIMVVGNTNDQFDFLTATQDVIPGVPVDKDVVLDLLLTLQEDYGSQQVDADQIWSKLPKAPDDYPSTLKGVLWMDQFGSYGYENITVIDKGANENLFTFGDTHLSTLDPSTRMIWVAGACGGAWTIPAIINTTTGTWVHETFCSVRPLMMQFVFNENYTIAEFRQYNQSGDLQSGVGSADYRGTMMIVPQPEGNVCPPADDATPEERNLCAKWIRCSYSARSPYPFIYPVFEIVGSDGQPREPYYSAYLNWMEEKDTMAQMYRPVLNQATPDSSSATSHSKKAHPKKAHSKKAHSKKAHSKKAHSKKARSKKAHSKKSKKGGRE